MIIGFGLLAAAAYITMRTCSFVADSVTVHGRIVDLVQDSGPRASGFHTVFSFADTNGHPHTVTTSFATDPPTHQIGNEVKVLFPVEHPESARIDSFSTLWLLPSIFYGFGSVFTVMGMGAYYTGRKMYGEK